MKEALCIAKGWHDPETGKLQSFGPKRNEVVTILKQGDNPEYWVLTEYRYHPMTEEEKQFAKAAFIILPDMGAEEMQELADYYEYQPVEHDYPERMAVGSSEQTGRMGRSQYGNGIQGGGWQAKARGKNGQNN